MTSDYHFSLHFISLLPQIMVYCDYHSYPRRDPSICDGLTLRPLPYPVLLILLVVSIFLGIKFYFVSDEAAETTEFHINWMLLLTPILLIFAVRLLSSFQGRRRRSYGGCTTERWPPASCCCYDCRGYCAASVPIYRPC